MTKLKYIKFVLENCETIKIDGKYIGDFLVDDIHTSFARMATNHVGRMDVADTFAIEIHKDANVMRNPFEGMFEPNENDGKHATFDRLKNFNDITSIEFALYDDYGYEDYYSYYVDWVGDSAWSNEAQKSYLSRDWNLYIVIAKDKKVEDFFDLEEIDDKEYMDFRFRMLEVGDKNQDKWESETEDVPC